MEQDELTVDPQYLKGFNNGYLIARDEPDLVAKLTAHPNDHSLYFKGLVGGKAEFEREAAREWAKSFSKQPPSKEDRGLDLER